MTRIESEHCIINSSQEEVFNFLRDMNNIEFLLPQDQTKDWKATEESCSFKIQKAATISLVRESEMPNNLIGLKSVEGTPFSFTLNIHINDKGDQTEAYLIFEGQINAFLKMMVERPLTNLFNYMANKVELVMNPV